MIPYEELDRALARWKAKAQGGAGMLDGAVEQPPTEVESSEIQAEAMTDSEAQAMKPTPSLGTPIVVDDAGSIPQPVASERTGEIDLAEIETYDD